jgi:hypothetical protein
MLFEQEVILRNKMRCSYQQNNQSRPESRYFFDRHVPSKGLNGLVGPIKKMALAERIFSRDFGNFSIYLQAYPEY